MTKSGRQWRGKSTWLDCVSYPVLNVTWYTTACKTLSFHWLQGYSSHPQKHMLVIIPECLSSEVGQNTCTSFLKKSFYLLPRWDNRVAKYLISIMLGRFHLDAEHFSWNDFKICRINAIFFCVVTVSLLLKVRMRIVSSEKGWGQMTEVNSHIFIFLGKGSSRLPVVPSLSW